MTARALGLVSMVVSACAPVSGGHDTNGNVVDSGTTGGPHDGGPRDGGPGGAPIKPEWVSGSRLRARVMTSGDGAKAFYGWYDTQLRLNCNVTLAGDGQRRCLPSVSAFLANYFADAACSSNVAQATLDDAASCAPTLARVFEQAQQCSDYGFAESRTRLYSISGAFTGTVYQKSGTTCTAQTNTTQFPYTAYRFYRLGSEVPPSTYAAITITTE